MYVHRPSILNRPLRAKGGQANEENLPKEAAKEEARLEFKSQRLAAAEERLIASYYPTPDDKQRAREEGAADAVSLAAARAAERSEAGQREADWLAQPKTVFVDLERPWTSHGSTLYLTHGEEAEARRRLGRDAAEHNRLAAAARAAGEAGQRASAQQALRQSLQAEESWFNRGAASERWLPLEQRTRHPAPASAPLQTPYFCDAAGEGAAAPRAEAPQRQRPSLAERYQRGESVASLLEQRPVAAPVGAAPPQPLQRDFPWTWKA